MSELDYRQEHGNQGSAPRTMDQPAQSEEATPQNAFKQMLRVMDNAVPNYRTPDAMAHALARRTPAVLVVSLALLFAGVVGSQLGVWLDGSLWGIPSLGAISLIAGLWMWSSNVVKHPNLSAEERDRVQRAIRLQLAALAICALALVYFLGMAIFGW